MLERLDAIEPANKKAFASYVARESGILLNTTPSLTYRSSACTSTSASFSMCCTSSMNTST